uniref:Integrase zinc-binding domain-containing protein n=1 Tax=Chromera velia CCMP2878 TaxID=1169474 RepID=A0A0G4IDK0_9ALVE|eukprot:Cvel_13303.t1-p1 / transcript=Cvel_13303.t1 / gene=Cvel_13303 / organism=Chromera_velia_CCMP2878 / gene_product=Protein NYNRIN, putative / transcript_product=Protein NYNRIN, putative / location=Cvel_scaffold903:10983-12535(+) / protein_length=158 / sequence_SO=supercontig / SO=protein_coding / is_pseudo=false
MENEILYYMKGDREQLVVPAALRDRVIASNHDHALFGHLRTRHTLYRVRESFWWPSMANDVKDWCETCRPCQRRTPARGTDPEVTSIPVSGPRELYEMDIVGTQEAVSVQWSSPPAKWFWFGMRQEENTRNTFTVGKDKEILRMHMSTRFREEVHKNT